MFTIRNNGFRLLGMQLMALVLAAVLLFSGEVCAQKKKKLPPQMGRLSEYFENYTNETYSNTLPARVEDIKIDTEQRRVHIYVGESFLMQPFTPSLVQTIYNDTKQLLPPPYNTYLHTIYACETPIELLIPADLLDRRDSMRTYMGRDYRGNAWVTPMSLPYSIKKGLQGRHLCLWQSHGRYYNIDKQKWEWQRPNLFCTIEDIFTQTFVVPYLIPMLERAGAVVFTPRERDWQKREIIVDNDVVNDRGDYVEENGKYEWENAGTGFAWLRNAYLDGQNPFEDGTCRRVEAITGKRMNSTIRWQPNIEEDGDYAVYVSYKTLLNSVPDATYTVRHEGMTTNFRVNQQMGGGTWVYLGTFHFVKGCSYDNCVMLSNQSNYRGVITADAVRFGGGMGNVARKDSTMEEAILSGLPRCLEAARYSAQWYGFHDTLYHARTDDYDDDIIVRPHVENCLSRGSVFHPGDSGRCVPIELSMGVHSDAGYRTDNSLIGTLGIYTTGFYDDKTAAGLSRLTSRDLMDLIMTQISNDITKTFGGWNRRSLYDRNYGESREPQVPAVLLELLSHQNWADMRLGHDPFFKFILSRAVYKAILRYLSFVHGVDAPVTQPMPVTDVAARLLPSKNRVQLSWEPSKDDLDPTAAPTHYIIYKATGDNGFDNGSLVGAQSTTCEIDIEDNTFYRFAVAAVNDGGASARSEEVCAYKSSMPTANVLIVDGFQRVAAPLAFDNDSLGGFDLNTDPGVPDVRTMGYCGQQLNFDKEGYGKRGADSFGFSGSELEGILLPGNTHDYAIRHARDILVGMPSLNISSCVGSAIERLPLSEYRVMDIAMGAQKADGYSLRYYKTFTPQMQTLLSKYTSEGGRVLLSGAYLGSDMQSYDERAFTKNVLKYDYMTSISADSIGQLRGMNTFASLYVTPNEKNYWIRQLDVLNPVDDAFCTMLYEWPNFSAAVAYPGANYRAMTYAFPLECITDEEVRRSIFSASMRFLLE